MTTASQVDKDWLVFKEIFDAHKAACNSCPDYFAEDNLILCNIDAESGECTDHSVGYDEQTVARRCAGCGEVLATYYELKEVRS